MKFRSPKGGRKNSVQFYSLGYCVAPTFREPLRLPLLVRAARWTQHARHRKTTSACKIRARLIESIQRRDQPPFICTHSRWIRINLRQIARWSSLFATQILFLATPPEREFSFMYPREHDTNNTMCSFHWFIFFFFFFFFFDKLRKYRRHFLVASGEGDCFVVSSDAGKISNFRPSDGNYWSHRMISVDSTLICHKFRNVYRRRVYFSSLH